MTWKVVFEKKPKLKNPVLVEGLPGIGNVGKVALDFITDEVGAQKIADFQSYAIPHSVFVNENNLIELPSIQLFAKQRRNKRDLLFLAGDVQPVDEQSCYSFADTVIDACAQLGCKEIITLGGVALKQIPKKPKVYCTGNNSGIVKAYKKGTNVQTQLYGKIGPILGVSGVLAGVAGKKKLKSVSLLAETYGHPYYVGLPGARELIRILNNKLELKLNLAKLDADIARLEQELAQRPELAKTLRRIKTGSDDITYIG